MRATQRPGREEFIAYWKDWETVSWCQFVPYLLYLGCLAVYALVVRRFDPEGRFWLPSFIAAIGYVIITPYLSIRSFHRRFARFIRCPSCGDWFGQDASGAYS